MRALIVIGALALGSAGCAGQPEPSGLGPAAVGGRPGSPAADTMAVDRDAVRSRAHQLLVVSPTGDLTPKAMRDIVVKTQLEEPDSTAGLRRRIRAHSE